MLTIHYLGRSQSERIVWLCEELSVSYELVRHDRDAVTILSPPALPAVHPLGAAPVIQDAGLLLAESAAIIEYIIVKHGDSRLRLGPDHPDFAAYLPAGGPSALPPHILAYLQRIGARPAYRRAMANGDPDLVPMLT